MNNAAAPSLAMSLLRLLAAVLFLGVGALAWNHHLNRRQQQASESLHNARHRLSILQGRREDLLQQILWLKSDPDYLQLRQRELGLKHAPGESLIVIRP